MPEKLPALRPMNGDDKDTREAIAIIGLSFKFPQEATSAQYFWEMLMQGRTASTETPKSRMHTDAFRLSGGRQFDKFTTSKACFIKDDIAAFDAPFFSISREEAETMDPQQRVLLETTYRAFENSAGLPIEKVSGSKTSVFVGNFTDDYKMMYCKDPEQPFQYGATGCLMSVLSSRLSWFFNLTGQSLSLDSACSSSLTAVDIACQHLLGKESDMSVVGASNLIFSPDMMLLLSSFNVLSPQGRSFVFDERANGYTRGEGHAVLILKRFSDALNDGDCIRAVIRSSGSNQDGHTPNGMAQPSRKAQESLIRHTYEKAGLSLSRTMFVEAHGTGTRLGDAVEVNAIGSSFKSSRGEVVPLSLALDTLKDAVAWQA
ncbi:Reducing polyketide synthase [Lachnellula hyalina]|uniref:Reducing polyketide synthase n=1 Tax=Lachnellula hyalina TaxID=1316788 RepID=A0A8H8QXH6_9HELO|nr:Reducing polyketide synthase [Lachnellula hyalina]TVY24316.1 Reducing polyketide synthase [Lachnellula hyalina]